MQEDLERLRRLLEERLGRPSRWSSVLTITSDPALRGSKPFRCEIIVNAALAGQDARWRTLLHETLQTFSPEYNRTDFDQLPGWEEGVVEQCQRLLRPEILAALDVTVDEAIFQEIEAMPPYNPYIEALEQILAHRPLTSEGFYLELLAVLIRQRKAFIYDMGVALPGDETRRYWKICSQ